MVQQRTRIYEDRNSDWGIESRRELFKLEQADKRERRINKRGSDAHGVKARHAKRAFFRLPKVPMFKVPMGLFARVRVNNLQDETSSNSDFPRFSISRDEDPLKIKAIMFAYVGTTCPKSWDNDYQKTLTSYAEMTRPDGSINRALRISTTSPYTVLVYRECADLDIRQFDSAILSSDLLP